MLRIEITEINIHVVKPHATGTHSPLLAFARIVLNDCFVVTGIKVIQGKGGRFISFPREYDKATNTGKNICYPIRKEVHEDMADRILLTYDAQVSTMNPVILDGKV